MAKSSSEILQGLISALIADCTVKAPRLHKEFKRDLSRLHSALEHRGLSFFTIDLPDAGKHFDKCLASGFLTKFKLPHMRPFKRGSPIPRLFKGLMMNVFHESGELRAHPDILSIELLRELFNFLKKLDMECSRDKTYRSVREFFEIEQGIRSPTLGWESTVLNARSSADLHCSDGCYPSVLHHHHTDQSDLFGVDEAFSRPDSNLVDVVQRTADVIAACLGRFNPSDWKAKHGPGAVSDLRGNVSKYTFPHWPEKLENRFPLSEFAFANYERWIDSVNDGSIMERFSLHEPPARLIAVPKTQKGPRLIASEPTCHQWIQQLMRSFLVDAIDRLPISESIRITDQTRNQEAAKAASLGSGHATVDLSSASDRLTCWVIERFFRRNPEFLLDLHACRTRWMVNPIDRRLPKYLLLKKFACQGSALTFPIQSIVYAVTAIACVLYARGLQPTLKNIEKVSKSVRVYGDDTVIPIDALGFYEEMLEYLDFKVNHTKTYGIGKFRESCGTEWYKGNNVTPVYFRSIPQKTRPESVISAIHVSNNFFSRGYVRVADLIKSTVQRCVPRNSVPFVAADSEALGWVRPMPDLEWKPRKRFCKKFQHSVIQVLTLSSKSSVVPDEGGASLLQYFTEAPEPDIVWKSGVRTRPKLHLKLRWERSDFFMKSIA